MHTEMEICQGSFFKANFTLLQLNILLAIVFFSFQQIHATSVPENLTFQRLMYMLGCTEVHFSGDVISENLYTSVFASQFSPHGNILSYSNVK